MEDPQVFLPTGILLTTSRKWILSLLLFPLLAVLMHLYMPELTFVVPVVAVITIVSILLSKQPLNVTISSRFKTLQYTYENCWGRNHTITVDLTCAAGHYEFEQFDRNNFGWHLLLYNGNYFRNRVSLKQKERGGFTKKQLDEMVALVHQYKR